VNAPSKAFGEWVEHHYDTPSFSAEQVQDLLHKGANVAVLDVRRFDEYQNMSIPQGVSVPGGEVVLRLRDLVPDPTTQVIINCAGRTRSIIGTQSLINAGVSNPVAALRNGTIGWTLAGQELAHQQQETYPPLSQNARQAAWQHVQVLAQRAGVQHIDLSQLIQWQADEQRTLYLFDVRSQEEYQAGHLPGTRHVPGGQLVQETDHYASVRGARIVLVDDDGVRANMAASWLAQMNWQVYVLDAETHREHFTESGSWTPTTAAVPAIESVLPQQLAAWLAEGETGIIDLTTSANFIKRRIPGAVWTTRGVLPQVLAAQPAYKRWVKRRISPPDIRYLPPISRYQNWKLKFSIVRRAVTPPLLYMITVSVMISGRIFAWCKWRQRVSKHWVMSILLYWQAICTAGARQAASYLLM